MNYWIAKQWIAIAEVFGWTVPAWIRRLIPESEIDDLLAAERDLTEALKGGSPSEFPLPAFLDTRIEQAIAESGESRRHGTRLIGLLIPSSAFAMAVVVGFVMLSTREAGNPAIELEPERSVAEVAVNVDPSRTLEQIGKGLSTLENGLIVKPLESEQKRLAADVAGALKFVSNSILPDAYAADVNSRLDTLREDARRSI